MDCEVSLIEENYNIIGQYEAGKNKPFKDHYEPNPRKCRFFVIGILMIRVER